MKFSYLIIFVVLCNFHRESSPLPIKGNAVFKLPKPLTSDTAITINGTMITKDNSLYVALSKGGNKTCEFIYNTSKKTISMTQSKDKTVTTEPYNFAETITPVTFSLLIEHHNVHSTIFEFNVNSTGPLSLTCVLESVDTVNRIIVKGATSINSLLFQYL